MTPPPPAPDCVAQVTPNRQLDQGLREVEQLLQVQGGKTLEDFELPIPAQLAAPGDAAVSEERVRYILFGGKVVVMGGDFRQLLPMVPWGTRGQIVDASFKRFAILWHSVKVRHLHENMCVQRLLAQGGTTDSVDAQQQQAWADYLQRIGEGIEQVFPKVREEAIWIPEDMCCQGDTIDSWSMKFTMTLAASQIRSHAMSTSFRGPF